MTNVWHDRKFWTREDWEIALHAPFLCIPQVKQLIKRRILAAKIDPRTVTVSQTRGTDLFRKLPYDILYNIASLLPHESILNLARSSRVIGDLLQ